MNQYSNDDLLNILERFKGYRTQIKESKSDKAGRNLFLTLKSEKEVFAKFSTVTQYWESEILTSESAILDEIESVISSIKDKVK